MPDAPRELPPGPCHRCGRRVRRVYLANGGAVYCDHETVPVVILGALARAWVVHHDVCPMRDAPAPAPAPPPGCHADEEGGD